MAETLLDDTLRAMQAAINLKPHVTRPSVSDSWTDAEILERLKTASRFADAVYYRDSRIAGKIWDLCDDTVVKVFRVLHTVWEGFPPESLALKFVHSYTSISVPLVRRYIQDERGYGYILLEKIDGTTLDKVWTTLSPSQRFGVALTLRDYIRQLRQASMHHPRSRIPGPLGPEDTPQICTGSNWLFESGEFGPFTSSAQLVQFLNIRHGLPKEPPKSKVRYKYRARGTFEACDPLVLTHMDLSLRNIILGCDGRLWLVDFEWAGFYPPWFEHLATMSAADNDAIGKESWVNKPGARNAAASWWRYIPFVTGSWQREASLHGYGSSDLKTYH